MEEFQLPIYYKEAEQELPARLITTGYTYRIEVEVENFILQFERDDEHNRRAILKEEGKLVHRVPDKDLVAAIIDSLEKHLS